MLGIREAEINVAEGKKQSRILTSEAYKMEQVNQAKGNFIYLVFALSILLFIMKSLQVMQKTTYVPHAIQM